jgi:hypothetical protein
MIYSLFIELKLFYNINLLLNLIKVTILKMENLLITLSK